MIVLLEILTAWLAVAIGGALVMASMIRRAEGAEIRTLRSTRSETSATATVAPGKRTVAPSSR